jgi:hypothetical protein
LVALAIALTSAAGVTAQQTTDPGALADNLPAAPAGWTSVDGEVVDSQAAGIDVAQVSRTYTNEDGAQVEFMIVGTPAMVAASAGAGMMFQNEMMLEQMNAANPDKQFAAIAEGAWSGWTVVDGEDGDSEATAFNEHLVVKIEINRADADLLATFVGLVPWAALTALHE